MFLLVEHTVGKHLEDSVDGCVHVAGNHIVDLLLSSRDRCINLCRASGNVAFQSPVIGVFVPRNKEQWFHRGISDGS